MTPGRYHPARGADAGRLLQICTFFALSFLPGAIAPEVCGIFILQERFTARFDELRIMSMHLQSLRNESGRLRLHEEFSSVKYAAGEDGDGNPSVR